MRPIQYLLLAMVAGGVAAYLGRLRTRLSDRLLACGLSAAAAAGILFPDASIVVANRLGVQRGVDLVMYVSLLTLSYLWALLYARHRQGQHRITRLARALAIAAARPAAAFHPASSEAAPRRAA